MPQPLLEVYHFLPEKSRLLRESVIAFCEAIAIVEIKTPDQYEGSVAVAKELTAFTKQANKQLADDKKPYAEKVKVINSFYKEMLGAVDELKRKVTGAIRTFDAIGEAKRREEQRLLDEKARKDRAAKEAQAAEVRRKADDARKAGEAAAAQELEAKAAEQEMEAAQTIAPVAQVAKPQTSGVSTVIRWKMEITDPFLFVQSMIEEKKVELIMPNAPAANKYAQMIKRPWTFPGGRVVSSQTSAVRT